MCSGRRELLIAVLSALFAVKIQIVPAAGIELAKTGNSAKICNVALKRNWKVVGNAMYFHARKACWITYE